MSTLFRIDIDVPGFVSEICELGRKFMDVIMLGYQCMSEEENCKTKYRDGDAVRKRLLWYGKRFRRSVVNYMNNAGPDDDLTDFDKALRRLDVFLERVSIIDSDLLHDAFFETLEAYF